LPYIAACIACGIATARAASVADAVASGPLAWQVGELGELASLRCFSALCPARAGCVYEIAAARAASVEVPKATQLTKLQNSAEV